jgi:hypothetical protein
MRRTRPIHQLTIHANRLVKFQALFLSFQHLWQLFLLAKRVVVHPYWSPPSLWSLSCLKGSPKRSKEEALSLKLLRDSGNFLRVITRHGAPYQSRVKPLQARASIRFHNCLNPNYRTSRKIIAFSISYESHPGISADGARQQHDHLNSSQAAGKHRWGISFLT